MATHKDRILFPAGKVIEGYTIRSLLGQGGFGDVYEVRNSSNAKFAMKTEYHNALKRAMNIEIGVMKNLKGNCFPQIYACGETPECKYLVMNLLGPSLSELRRSHMNILGQELVFHLGLQMLKVIEKFHEFGYVHRDIKLSNFLIKNDPDCPLVLIDFGLAKPYMDFETKEMLPPQNGHYVGTKKYASINSHKKLDLGRRDDLYSWFYAFFEILKGKLPWRNMPELDDVLKCKETQINNFIQPYPVLVKIYNYLNKLEFQSKPDYEYLYGLLHSEMDRKYISKTFDWEMFYIQEVPEDNDETEKENNRVEENKIEEEKVKSEHIEKQNETPSEHEDKPVEAPPQKKKAKPKKKRGKKKGKRKGKKREQACCLIS